MEFAHDLKLVAGMGVGGFGAFFYHDLSLFVFVVD